MTEAPTSCVSTGPTTAPVSVPTGTTTAPVSVPTGPTTAPVSVPTGTAPVSVPTGPTTPVSVPTGPTTAPVSLPTGPTTAPVSVPTGPTALVSVPTGPTAPVSVPTGPAAPVSVPLGSTNVTVQSQQNTTGQTSAHPPLSSITSTHNNVSATTKFVGTGSQTAPSTVVVGAQVPTTVSASGQPPQSTTTRPPLIQMTTMAQTSGRTLVIIQRPTTPQPVAVAPRPRQAPTVQLPANFQIPAGMVLVRSDSGQLMLVSQQALAQAQALQGKVQRTPSGSAPRLPSLQVSTTTAVTKAENPPVIRIAAPPSVQAATVQKTAVVKVIGATTPRPTAVPSTQSVVRPVVQSSSPAGKAEASTPKAPPPTITWETLENVKKCKSFLVTLIKLASSGTQSAGMASNVRELVRSLLDGSMEPEEFTEQLYRELKSSPQPYLVPFLKKSLPAVRHLTPNPQLFIQQVDQPKVQASTSKAPASAGSGRAPALLSANIMHSTFSRGGGHTLKPTHLVFQHPKAVTVRPGMTSSAQSHTLMSMSNKAVVIQSGHHHTGSFAFKRPFVQGPPPSTKCAFKAGSGYYKEDDDINDVASMAGVNLKEEKARILACDAVTTVGSMLHSCQDEPFLPPGPLLARILHSAPMAVEVTATDSSRVVSFDTCQAVGVTDVRSEAVSLVSHATQERLRGLLEKVIAMAEHRKIALKEDQRHTQVNDVRAQLRFLEEVERLRRQRKDDEEKEKLLHIARSRSHSSCPDLQLLKQQAKEFQQLENAEIQQRQANLAALAAIGPRKKKPQDSVGNQLSVLSRVGVQRVTRVTLRDLLLCMEQDHTLRHSLILYKALLK